MHTPSTSSRTLPAPDPPRSSRRRRLVLRPGVHVLRRSADELQVGLDPARALVLPDSPAVRSALAVLTSPASVVEEQSYDDPTHALLADAGLLLDADILLPLIPTGPRRQGASAGDRVSRVDVAALALDAGDHTARLLEARAKVCTEIVVWGGSEARRLAAGLGELLAASGLACVQDDPGPAPRGTGGAGHPIVAVVVAVGEPARERVDGLMREGTPHLFLRLVEGHAVVGPFVLPGDTACLRCIDAHHTDADSAWPLLLAQYATAATREREDTLPEPVDPLLATLATAWAAREVMSFAEGRPPATASTTLRLDPHLTALETQRWPRHPACGCSWA